MVYDEDMRCVKIVRRRLAACHQHRHVGFQEDCAFVPKCTSGYRKKISTGNVRPKRKRAAKMNMNISASPPPQRSINSGNVTKNSNRKETSSESRDRNAVRDN